MKPVFFIAAFALLSSLPIASFADEGPTVTSALSPAETAFVASVTTALTARFPHVADAEKAGYVRYTSADDTGAISYADKHWNADPTHPSQLWYDAKGDLMGADFSMPRPNNDPRPNLWGVNPGRWYEFNGHVHYVVREPGTGKTVYDGWIWNADFVKLGGNLDNPSAATVVKAGRVRSADYISTIFEFPTQWDLIVWVRPHSPNALHW